MHFIWIPLLKVIACCADEGKDKGRGLLGLHCCSCGFRDKESRSFFHWTHRTECNKETRFFFFFFLPPCPIPCSPFLTQDSGYQCLSILRYRHQDWYLNILISSSKQNPGDVSGVAAPRASSALSPGVIRKCQNSAVVIHWSRYIREEADELPLPSACELMAYENTDGVICMCTWMMQRRLLV